MIIHVRIAVLTAVLSLSAWNVAARQSAAPVTPVPAEKPVLHERPYDGSGSVISPAYGEWTPNGSRDADLVAYEKERAEAEAGRQVLATNAAKGDIDALTQLAARVEQGDSYAAPDHAAALDLYEKAAGRGNIIALQKMCIAYLLGEGRPVNVDKGLDYGAALGKRDAVGVFSAGYDYETGASGPKDLDAARAAYIQAGKLGSGEAMDALGRLSLADGKLEVARHLFREGTYLGSADAMGHLARMAEKGDGGVMDAAEAYWLYVQAARRGNIQAADWVAALPVDSRPLNRTVMLRNKDYTKITRTWTEDGAGKKEVFTLVTLITSIANRFPEKAIEDRRNGEVNMHCYVGGDHVIDACVITREFPIGYKFGALLSWLFESHLTLDAQDVASQPTAHSVLVFSVKYQSESGRPRP